MRITDFFCLAISFSLATFAARVDKRALDENFDENVDNYRFVGLNNEGVLDNFASDQRYGYEVFRHVRETPLDLSRTRGDSLTAVTAELRSYLNATSFNNAQFGERITRLQTRMDDIRAVVNQFIPYNDEVVQRFRWATHLFEVLQIVNRNMRRATLFNDQFHRLLYDTSELQAIVMGMFNLYGQPDRQMVNYSTLVSQLASRRNEFELTFGNFSSIPLNLRVMIWDNLMRTEEALRILSAPGDNPPPPPIPLVPPRHSEL